MDPWDVGLRESKYGMLELPEPWNSGDCAGLGNLYIHIHCCCCEIL